MLITFYCKIFKQNQIKKKRKNDIFLIKINIKCIIYKKRVLIIFRSKQNKKRSCLTIFSKLCRSYTSYT